MISLFMNRRSHEQVPSEILGKEKSLKAETLILDVSKKECNFEMNQRIVFGFGPQLVLDLHGCNKEKLIDREFIYRLLDGLPSKIGMTKIADPHLVYYQGPEDSFDKGGFSGFVLIAESHIAIHTFVEQEHAFVDIFSCKDFDVELATQHLIEALEAKSVDKQLFARGREFPKEVAVIEHIVKKDRRAAKASDPRSLLKE